MAETLEITIDATSAGSAEQAITAAKARQLSERPDLRLRTVASVRPDGGGGWRVRLAVVPRTGDPARG